MVQIVLSGIEIDELHAASRGHQEPLGDLVPIAAVMVADVEHVLRQDAVSTLAGLQIQGLDRVIDLRRVRGPEALGRGRRELGQDVFVGPD